VISITGPGTPNLLKQVAAPARRCRPGAAVRFNALFVSDGDFNHRAGLGRAHLPPTLRKS